jgi:hypothetical protein
VSDGSLPGLLYHYTDIARLQGTLESRTFRGLRAGSIRGSAASVLSRVRTPPPGSFPVLFLCQSRPGAVAELQRFWERQAIGIEGLLVISYGRSVASADDGNAVGVGLNRSLREPSFSRSV